MFVLVRIVYSLLATTLAGVGAVIALVAGYSTLPSILLAAVIGALVALPVSWLVARALYDS